MIAGAVGVFAIALLLGNAFYLREPSVAWRPAWNGEGGVFALFAPSVSSKLVPARCTISEVARHPLRVGSSQELYVEPNVLEPSGGELLLAGKPVYMFTRHEDSDAEVISENTVFGVVIGPDDDARTIPHPPGIVRTKPLAAVSIGHREWAVIFSEIDATDDSPTWFWSDSTVGRLWHGEYRLDGWSSLQELPLPNVARFSYWGASRLVMHADTAVWAVPLTRPDGTGYAAVFERIDGRWTHLEIERDMVGPPVYTTLTYWPERGFVLGLVQVDHSLPADYNSLFLYVRDEGWRRLRKAIAGLGQPVFAPSLIATRGNRGLLSWWTTSPEPTYEMRAMSGALLDSDAPTVVVDPAMVEFGFHTVVALPGGPYWISNHLDSASELPHIRVARTQAAQAEAVWSVENPYTGFFGAASPGEDEVIIAGPRLDRQAPKLVTLLVRLRFRCSGSEHHR